MPADHEFVQTSEKGASETLRNSCLKCGRTKEAHEPLPPTSQVAEEWLMAHGLHKATYYRIVRSILMQYIEETRQ